MNYRIALVLAALVTCTSATAQTSTTPRPAPPVVHKTPAAPTHWDSVTGEQRDKLARRLCSEGYPLSPYPIGELSKLAWESFYVHHLTTCRVTKEQVEAALKGPADDKVAPSDAAERKDVSPHTRGLPRCEQGTFDTTYGMCVRTNVTTRTTED